MTQKTIMIGLVALAFVAGSIMTGTMASAQKGGAGDNLIIDALNNIATAISGIDPNVTVEPTPVTVNVDPTPITINAPEGEKGDKGDTGTDGAKGDKGDQGDTGSAGVGVNPTYVRVNTGDNGSASIQCASGDIATGGGGDSLSSLDLDFSVPLNSGGQFAENDGTTTGWIAGTDGGFVRVYVICMDITP